MIETARLILRPPVEADHPALFAMWADPEVMAALGPIKDEEASRETLGRHGAHRGEGLGFCSVLRKEDGAVIGFCGLKRGEPYTPVAGEVEAGWIIAREHWRQGYAHEAMVAALPWGWANLNAQRIVAITPAINHKSRALMERLGMTRLSDGDFEHSLFAEGDPLRPNVTYAIDRP